MTGVVALLGAGSWGTALACTLSYLPPSVRPQAIRLWGRDTLLMERLASTRENSRYLPGFPLPALITPTADLKKALEDAEKIFLVVPAQHIASLLATLPLPSSVSVVVGCAKGIEVASGRFVSEIVAEHCPRLAYAVLSGPSFSADVAARLPTAVTVASADLSLARELCNAWSHDRFRLYASDDVCGVEIGGACKNVLALACGIVEGRKLGLSARAALTTRALAEIGRFAVASGAKEETLSGLSGWGDALLTCTSTRSRNYAFGCALGAGEGEQASTTTGSVKRLLARSGTVEGAWTARALQKRASSIGLNLQRDLPILSCVAAILDETMTIDEALQGLFARPLVAERR